MKKYAKNALGYILKAPRMVRMPNLPRVPRMPDVSREKRIGVLALLVLSVVFTGVLYYRFGTSTKDAPVPGQTLALAGDSDKFPSAQGVTSSETPSGTKSRFAAPTSGAFASSSNPSTTAKTPIMPAAATTTSNDRYADYRSGGVAMAGDTPQKPPATLPKATAATALASDNNPLRPNNGPTPSLSGTVTPLGGASNSSRSDARILPTSGTEPVAGTTTAAPAPSATPVPASTSPVSPPAVTGSLPSSKPGSSLPASMAPTTNGLPNTLSTPNALSPTPSTPSVNSSSLAGSTSSSPSAAPVGALPVGLSGSSPAASVSAGTIPPATSLTAAPLTGTTPPVGNPLSSGTSATPSTFGTAPTNRATISSSTNANPLGNNPYGGTANPLPKSSGTDRYAQPSATPLGTNLQGTSPSTNAAPPGTLPGNPYGPANLGTTAGAPSSSPYGNQLPTGNQAPRGTLSNNPYGTQQPAAGAPSGFQNTNPVPPTGGFNPPPQANQPLVNPGTVTLRDGRSIKVRVYKVREGDTLFDIARYELGKASRWSEIFQINQPRLGDMLEHLSPGMDILIPDVTTGAGPQGNQILTRPGEREPLTTSRNPAIPR